MPAPIGHEASHCAEKHPADLTSASSGSAGGTDSDASFQAELEELEEKLAAQSSNDEATTPDSSTAVEQQIAALLAQMGVGASAASAPSTTPPAA